MSVPVRPLGAVGRNQVCRRLRAALDRVLPPEGCDVLVTVRADRPPAVADLEAALEAVLRDASAKPFRRAAPADASAPRSPSSGVG